MDRKWMIALGVAGVGTTGFLMTRVMARKELIKQLQGSPLVVESRSAGLIAWTDEEKAVEALPLFSFESADRAFAKILSEIPVPPQTLLEEAADWSEDAKEELENQLGLEPGTVDAAVESGQSYAKSAYESLPAALQFDLPGIDLW
jgi:hypothetical protein